MIELDIPGRGILHLQHLVLDVNGTLAFDGELIPGVADALARLQTDLQVHLLTANTHGRQDGIDRVLQVQASIIPRGGEAVAKESFVNRLGAQAVVAIGQGANDASMLAKAAIGICVLSREGTAVRAIQKADVLMPDIHAALDALENPRRLVATLRA